MMSLSLITAITAAGLIAPASTAFAKAPLTQVQAAPASATIDTVTFGSESSESEHKLQTQGSTVGTGAKGQAVRFATPLQPATDQLGDIEFTMAVDPVQQNHVTLKFWGEDRSAYKTRLLVNGEHISYANAGDHEAINVGTQGGLPGRFFYSTALLPLSMTQGQTKVRLTIRTAPATAGASATEQSRGYYQAFTHVQPSIVPNTADTAGYEKTGTAAPALTAAEEQAAIDSYRTAQITRFNTLSTKVDAAPAGSLSITKYANELRYYAETLSAEWSPADSPEKKRAALQRIFKSIDNYTRQYYSNVKSLGSGGHQSDWGGYYSELGEALYIVENLIADDSVLGQQAYQQLLAEPFVTGTVDGPNSIAGTDFDGGALTRAKAWERVLKANFDFARSRLSYISNQVHYTYEGAWKSHEGLRVIGSGFYEGKERSHEIIREIWGISPFLGEEVLVGPQGQALNVYHSLFLHDQTAEYTEDYLNIIMRGLAKSSLTSEGKVERRLPYGGHYVSLTRDAALLRENRYVGSYGETANWLPTYFFRTLGHAGDEVLNDQLLQITLQNFHSRALTRYQGTDAEGHRVMYMEQVVDERNTAYPGKVAYATESAKNGALLFASLEKHMADNESRYTGEAWEKYWGFAREAVGVAQQQLVDNQYFPSFKTGTLANINNDHRVPETWKYVTEKRAEHPRFGALAAGVVLPNTDLDLYTDEELAKLGVTRESDDARSAWVDIDNLFIRLRDGGTTLFGSLAMRNYGYSANGRLHVQQPGWEQNVQVRTEGDFEYKSSTVRQDSTYNPIFVDQAADTATPGLAWAGELTPVTYQPGVGEVNRDNFAVDTPYSAYPDVISTAYGKYFIAMNTTRKEYGNHRGHSVKVPGSISNGKILDLVSGNELDVKEGTVELEPGQAIALVADGSDTPSAVPSKVDTVVATPSAGAIGLSWRPSSGAESYTISRASKNNKFVPIATSVAGESYIDKDPAEGPATYRVTAVSAAGAAKPSSEVTAQTVGSAVSGDWSDGSVGNVGTPTLSAAAGNLSIAVGGGAGFGSGDDFNIYDRWSADALAQVTQLEDGDFAVHGKIVAREGSFGGVTIRDAINPTARYVALGANAEGNLELRARALDSRANLTGLAGRTGAQGEVVSPRVLPLEGLTLAEYPHLRLERSHEGQRVAALVSRDGINWQRAAQISFAAGSALHAGFVSTGSLTAQGAEVEDLDAAAIRASVSSAKETAQLRWNKPKNAASFSVYRAGTADTAATDPLSAPGWTKVADDIHDTGITQTVVGPDAHYRVVAFGADNQPLATSEAVTAKGYPLADLIATARATDLGAFTQASGKAFLDRIAAIEKSAGDPGADINELGKQVLAARSILVPVFRHGFEASEAAVWKPAGSAPASYTRAFDDTAGTARTGSRSIFFTSTDTTGNHGYNLWFAANTASEPRIAAKPSTQYKVSFWYQLTGYVPAKGVGAYYFARSNNNATGIGTEQRNWLPAGDTAPGEWRKFERVFTTDSGNVNALSITLGLRGSSGTFRVDDLVVEPVAP